MTEQDPARANWATTAEQELGHVVPHSYLPWWISAPAWALVAWGAVTFVPQLTGPLMAGTAATTAFLIGLVVRRLPHPTLLRFWSALSTALMGFICALIATLNTDSLLLTTWATLVGALTAYSVVMCARRDIFSPRPLA